MKFAHSTSRTPFEFSIGVGVDFWKKLWKVVIPNSAKIYMWRVCLNILPSMERLVSRRVPLDSHVCVLCENSIETTLHVCRDCPFTKQILQSKGVLAGVCYSPQAVMCELLEWLCICTKELSLQSLGDLVYLLWGIWKERNARVWDDKRSHPCDVLLKTTARLQEFRFHAAKSAGGAGRSRSVRWSAPPSGMYKINFDGSFNHVSRKGSVGFIVRDSNGHMVAGGVKPLSGLLSPEHAEVVACKMATEFAVDQALLPAILETDSILVQGQLNKPMVANTSVLGRIYEDVGSMLEVHTNLRITHTRRSANKAAHLMAAYASSLAQECFYFSTPSFLIAAIAADSCLL